MASATFRTACTIAAICALSLSGCQNPPPDKAPEAARAAPPAPPPATPKAAQTPAAVALAPVEAPAPKPLPKKKAPAKKRAAKPAPVAQPAPPPPPPPPQVNPEEERAKKRDAYLAALSKSTFAFNPPTPIEVGQKAAVALTVSTPPETAQLADDLRKSLADGWSPRLRARLGGADFAIAPAEGKDFDGMKELSITGRTDWSWGVVPASPGSKKLVATLAVGLPPAIGGPRELPTLSRAIEVEPTLGWRAERLWSEYW